MPLPMTQPPMKAREEPAVQFRVALKAPPAPIAHCTVWSAFRPTDGALGSQNVACRRRTRLAVLRANEGDLSPTPAPNIPVPLRDCLQVWFLKNRNIG